jgi:hypothetical protein
MQKSGTTMLQRLLAQTGLFPNIQGGGEGDAFWGNVPPFTPGGHPCGTIYRKHQGKHGHEADSSDATEAMQRSMNQKLKRSARTSTGWVMNKNPYNVLRLPWLREIYPNAYIVLIERDPVANAYSLKKRYVTMRKNKPQEPWWGTKPRGWKGMVRPTEQITEQIALQLRGIHVRIAATRHHADCCITYESLCRDPTAILRHIVDVCHGSVAASKLKAVSPLRNFNVEYQQGASLISQNKLARTNNPRARRKSDGWLPPFTEAEIKLVKNKCTL